LTALIFSLAFPCHLIGIYITSLIGGSRDCDSRGVTVAPADCLEHSQHRSGSGRVNNRPG